MGEIFFESLYNNNNNPYAKKESDKDIIIATLNEIEIKFLKSVYYNYKKNNIDFTLLKTSENLN